MNDKKVDPIVFISKRKGLRLYIKPETKEWNDRDRKYTVIPAVIVKFEDNRFVATTQEEIDYLNSYNKKHPDEVYTIGDRNKKIIDALQEEEKNDIKLKVKATRGRKKSGQGAVGGSTTSPEE